MPPVEDDEFEHLLAAGFEREAVHLETRDTYGTEVMADAGEDIRWVPRSRVCSVAVPGNDFYLFDDRLAVFLLYAGNGLAAGKIASTDPADLRLSRSAFEAAWKLSIPHRDYTAI